MKKFYFIIAIILIFQLIGCSKNEIKTSSTVPNSNANSSNINEISSEAVSSTQEIPRKVNIMKPKDEKTLTEKEKWYLDFVNSIDIITGLAFTDPNQIEDRHSYFLYLVITKYIYGSNNTSMYDKYFDKQKNTCVIPIKDIRSLLKIYLGIDKFDPMKAFKDEIVYQVAGEGYNPKTDEYYAYDPEAFGGVRITGLLNFLDLGNNTFEVTVAFYNDYSLPDHTIPNNNEFFFDAYKTHTLKIKENPNNPKEFLVLNAYYKYYFNDGSTEIVDNPNVRIDESLLYN